MQAPRADAPPGSSRLGQTVGKYRLHAILGAGGMSTVYAATHRNGFSVAIKMLHAPLASDEAMCRWFRREGKLANIVNHPGAVRVHDDDVTEDGVPYLVVERLYGEALRAIWERAGRKLEAREVAVLAYEALDILAAAHARGLVHRDVKPDNLYLTDDGVLKLLDFGIAHPLPVVGQGASMATMRIAGTPAFMAPEQARGIDVRAETDIWGVGATMFALIAGEHVHAKAPPPDLLLWASTRPARSIRDLAHDLPVQVATVMDRALAFEPHDRFATAGAMRTALAEAYRAGFGEDLAETRERVVGHLRSRLPGAPRPVVEGVKVHSVATRPPPRSGSTEMRGAVTRTQAYTENPPSRRLRRFALLFAGSTTVLALLIGFRAMHRSATATSLSGGGPPSPATIYYEAGLRAMYGASTDLARALFDKATVADPSLAAAHLRYLALMSYVDDSARKHYSAAEQFRQSLTEEDRQLLDALALVVAANPDSRGCVSRLEELSQAYPNSRNILLALSRRLLANGESRGAAVVADRLIALDSNAAAAWQLRGAAYLEVSDVDGGRRSYLECLRVSPRAISCLRDLGDLELLDGRCDKAAEYSRALIADDPQNGDWYYRLALATFNESGNISTAREALLQSWHLLPPEDQATATLSGDVNIALVQGHFDEALGLLDRLDRALEGVPHDAQHLIAARARMSILLELGDRVGALAAAHEFLAKSPAWNRNGELDFRIYGLSTLYQSGELGPTEYRQQRDEWAKAAEARGEGSPAIRWLLGWAASAKDAADAAEAVRALPPIDSFEAPIRRDPESEEAIGRTYLLAGLPREGVPHLSRGARACMALASPIPSTRSHLELAQALALEHLPSEACKEYSVVQTRWGRDKRSISATTARESAARLGCKPFTTTKTIMENNK